MVARCHTCSPGIPIFLQILFAGCSLLVILFWLPVSLHTVSPIFCVSNSLILSNILDARVGDFTHPQVREVLECQLVADAMCES